ncbi:MAG TPA: hypothetical protein VFC46_03140, partial [Humisphaera sp.]|nr:hypothetical protein [Humisphaera sp.]
VLTCRYYEMLTGEIPFKATDAATMLYEHCYRPFPDAALKATGLPDGVILVLARGSEKDPADRYQSAAEMTADLTALLELSDSPGKRGAVKRLYADVPAGTDPSASLPMATTSSGGSSKSNGLKIIYALLAIIAVGAVMAFFAFRDKWNPGTPPAEPPKAIAQAPRYVPPSIPATTQAAAIANPAPTTTVASPIEKAPPVARPLDVPAYLRGLGITDKQMPERGVPLRTFDLSLPIPPNEWRTLAPLMDDVQYIIFHNQSGDDEAISHVAKLRLLRRLSLDGQPVTDKGCAFLKDHPSLERLDLANTAISGAAIADLASIPNLSALDLRKTGVRGACWKPLLHSRVSSLWLANNPIEDRDLADLAGDPSLSMVQLSSTNVTDAVIDTLASMPNFRQGDFAQTSIDDVGALKLSRLPNIVTLELSGCPIGEDSLAPLAKLQKLRRLLIRNLSLSDSALEGLAECAQLETIDMSGCSFNASGLGTLNRLSMLRFLRVGGAKIMMGSSTVRQALDNLKQKLPGLVIEGTPEEVPAR